MCCLAEELRGLQGAGSDEGPPFDETCNFFFTAALDATGRRGAGTMTMATSPCCFGDFVPLTRALFPPPWASHDFAGTDARGCEGYVDPRPAIEWP